MTTSAPALGLMLGLAVGIDYTLFIIRKYSSLRARLGLDAVEATAHAVATAGGAASCSPGSLSSSRSSGC